MTTAKKSRTQDSELTATELAELAELERRVIPRRTARAGRRLELPLDGVRKAFGKTQVDVADATGMAQPDVSRIERSDSLEEVGIGTLRRYLAALGGELELVVACPNGARIVVTPGAQAAPAALAKAKPKESKPMPRSRKRHGARR